MLTLEALDEIVDNLDDELKFLLESTNSSYRAIELIGKREGVNTLYLEIFNEIIDQKKMDKNK